MDQAPRLRDRLEHAGVRLLAALLRRLPPAGARAMGRLTGAAVSARSRRAEENLRAAFPEASAARRAAWVRGMWENLGEAAREFARMPSLTPARYFQEVEVEGLDLLRASHAAGKGVVIYSGHFANWEYQSLLMPFSGLPMAAVARRMRNPLVDAFITRVRENHGVRILPHRSAVREGLRLVKAGGIVGMLIDQRITAGGVQVPFFGRPAHTTTMPALLAMRTGAAAHGLSSRRVGGKIRVTIHPRLDMGRFGGDAAAAAAAMTAELESWIREDPRMWLWLHDRWKT